MEKPKIVIKLKTLLPLNRGDNDPLSSVGFTMRTNNAHVKDKKGPIHKI